MTTELPAGWSPRTSILGDQWSAVPADLADAALSLAVAELWALSGRQFGTWSITLAPYLAPHRPNYLNDSYYGVPYYLFDAAAGTVSAGVGVGGPTVAFQLPRPAVSVEQVQLDGRVLEEGVDWAFDPAGTLVWLGDTSHGGWPIGQNVYRPRWLVTYTRGVPVPDEAQTAAARYALAIAQGLGAPGVDKVPGRARDYSRNNVNVQLADPTALSNAGLTGVPLVDAWLRTVNPHGIPRAATLWSPEQGRHRVLNRVGQVSTATTTAPAPGSGFGVDPFAQQDQM